MESGDFLIRGRGYNLLTVTSLTPTTPDTPCDSPNRAATGSTASDLVRLRFDIAYDGTDFHGWAAQRDKPTGEPVRTVQATLESTLEKVLRTPVQLTVAGRTDAGVHASGQVAHADVPVSCLDTRSIAGDPGNLVRRVARLLPADVTLRGASFAPSGFDARFSALRRHYVYRVTSCVSARFLPVLAIRPTGDGQWISTACRWQLMLYWGSMTSPLFVDTSHMRQPPEIYSGSSGSTYLRGKSQSCTRPM